MFNRPDRHDANAQPWLNPSLAPMPEPGAMRLALQPRHALCGGALRAVEASSERGAGGLDDASRVRGLGWLLGRACREAQDWNAVQDVPRITVAGALRFVPSVVVSVDMPASLLRTDEMVEQAERALSQSGLAPWLLEIVLPEQMVARGQSDLFRSLTILRDMGVGIALEGFGSLAASPRLLQRLQPTAVKLDPGVTRDIATDRDMRATVKAAIALAHGLGATALASDVNDAAQRDILGDLGCDDAQGRLFGGVLRPEVFLASLIRASAR